MESKYVTFGIIILPALEVLGQNMNDVMKIHCRSKYRVFCMKFNKSKWQEHLKFLALKRIPSFWFGVEDEKF